eukprot:scaffold5389_cov87-Phaeocystis_antarctica.AAC.1
MLYAASAPPPPACTVSSCDWFHETGYAWPGRTPPASGSGRGSDHSKPSPPTVCRKRRLATPRGVPPSKMRVGKTSTPVSSPSCVASLVASSESTPASISGVSSCTV